MSALIAQILHFAINIYIFIIILEVIISWLIVFDVINIRNEKAQNLITALKKATDPVMQPVRRYVPPIAGLDLTPIIVIFGLTLLQRAVWAIFT